MFCSFTAGDDGEAAGGGALRRNDSMGSSFQSADSAFTRSCSLTAADGNVDGVADSAASEHNKAPAGEAGGSGSSPLVRSRSKKTSFAGDVSEHGGSKYGGSNGNFHQPP